MCLLSRSKRIKTRGACKDQTGEQTVMTDRRTNENWGYKKARKDQCW